MKRPFKIALLLSLSTTLCTAVWGEEIPAQEPLSEYHQQKHDQLIRNLIAQHAEVDPETAFVAMLREGGGMSDLRQVFFSAARTNPARALALLESQNWQETTKKRMRKAIIVGAMPVQTPNNRKVYDSCDILLKHLPENAAAERATVIHVAVRYLRFYEWKSLLESFPIDFDDWQREVFVWGLRRLGNYDITEFLETEHAKKLTEEHLLILKARHDGIAREEWKKRHPELQ